MGMTWIALMVILKRWLLVPGFSALVGSINEDMGIKVQLKGSLFFKLKYALERLPKWLLPKNFDFDKHFQTSSITNPENDNTIEGKAPTEKFGVGDRKTCIYFDDFAQWEYGAEAWENTKATTNCRLATWTANGLNHAYEIRYGKGRFKNTRTAICQIHWSADPRKSATAVDEVTGETYNIWKRARLGVPSRGIYGDMSQDQFDKDYEFKYESSQVGRIYAEQMKFVEVGHFPYDPRFSTYTSVDPGVGDLCVIGWFQWDYIRKRIRLVDLYFRNGFGASYYIPLYTGRDHPTAKLKHEHEYDQKGTEAIARHTSWQKLNLHTGRKEIDYAAHYGDPAIKQRSASDGKSFKEVMQGNPEVDTHNIEIEVKEDEGKNFKTRIEKTRDLLYHFDINETLAGEIVEKLNKYQWDTADDASKKKEGDRKTANRPKHDENSHFAAMLEYFAVNCTHEDEWREAQTSHSRGEAASNLAVFGHPEMIPTLLGTTGKRLLAEQLAKEGVNRYDTDREDTVRGRGKAIDSDSFLPTIIRSARYAGRSYRGRR